jgi:hypothetical protein
MIVIVPRHSQMSALLWHAYSTSIDLRLEFLDPHKYVQTGLYAIFVDFSMMIVIMSAEAYAT